MTPVEGTRKQQSSIDRLPPDILEQLQALLRDPRVVQKEATRRINAILAEQDAAGALPDDAPKQVSKTTVNRYDLRLRKVGEKIRQSREIAKMWIGRLGAEPQGAVGKLLNEMVRNLAFDATVAMADGETPVEPKMLKDMAIAIERLERAASENVKRDEQIRQQERERLRKETLAAVESASDAGPMTAETLKEKIREVYGV